MQNSSSSSSNDVVTAVPTSTSTCDLTRLDICLAKCTNPLNEINEEMIDELCLVANSESNGPFSLLRFLAYKAQSPQESEALHSLKVLELVIIKGGYKICEELGKFRFLNEIIKIVSPKYLAHQTSARVSQKIIELIFQWSMDLKEFPKIFEAYQMLKVQKIVTEDPVHVLKNYRPPTPPQPRPKDEIFDDEETVQTLRSLITSGRSENFAEANRLIKFLADKAETRMQFKLSFNSELESAKNCSQLLNDMLIQCQNNLRIDLKNNKVIYKGTTDEDLQLMNELLTALESSRVKLFKYSNEISENDYDELDHMIEISNILMTTINNCKKYFQLLNDPNLICHDQPKSSIKIDNAEDDELKINRVQEEEEEEERLLDLNTTPFSSPSSKRWNRELDEIENDLTKCNQPQRSQPPAEGQIENVEAEEERYLNDFLTNPTKSTSLPLSNPSYQITSTVPTIPEPTTTGNILNSSKNDLNDLTKMLFKLQPPLSLSSNDNNNSNQNQNQRIDLVKNIIGLSLSTSTLTSTTTTRPKFSISMANLPKNPIKLNQNQQLQQLQQQQRKTEKPMKKKLDLYELLSNITISYDDIKPCNSMRPPLLLLNNNGLIINLHFTGNKPHRNISVFLLTFSNYNSSSINNIQFLAAVPKKMKVKLQYQTGSSLPGLEKGKNFPEIFISQVMLIAYDLDDDDAAAGDDDDVYDDNGDDDYDDDHKDGDDNNDGNNIIVAGVGGDGYNIPSGSSSFDYDYCYDEDNCDCYNHADHVVGDDKNGHFSEQNYSHYHYCCKNQKKTNNNDKTSTTIDNHHYHHHHHHHNDDNKLRKIGCNEIATTTTTTSPRTISKQPKKQQSYLGKMEEKTNKTETKMNRDKNVQFKLKFKLKYTRKGKLYEHISQFVWYSNDSNNLNLNQNQSNLKQRQKPKSSASVLGLSKPTANQSQLFPSSSSSCSTSTPFSLFK